MRYRDHGNMGYAVVSEYQRQAAALHLIMMIGRLNQKNNPRSKRGLLINVLIK